MKNSKMLPIITLFMLIASIVPAYAEGVGLNGNLDIKAGEQQQNSNDNDKQKDPVVIRADGNSNSDNDNHGGVEINPHNVFSYNQVKAWMVSAGTVGQVTAVSSGSLTIKTSANEIFVVNTTNATVRRGEDNDNNLVINVGDTVYVLGVKNAGTIVASAIIVGKSRDEVKPNPEEKRQAFFGTITAKTDTTVSILSANNVSYTVSLASDAQIWINKVKQSSLSGFAVGDNVMVQGTLSGSAISANKLLVVHLPVGTIIGKVTVINGDTLTVLGTDNKTYTVLSADAAIKAKGGKDDKRSILEVGDNVMVKGDLSGNTLTAQSVTEERLKSGFFYRFGLFFKGIFGHRD